MTNTSHLHSASADDSDQRLSAILQHLYRHPVPERILDDGVLSTVEARRTRGARLNHRMPSHLGRYGTLSAAAAVAIAIAVLISTTILHYQASPSSASALTVLRRAAAALEPTSGTAMHRVYSLSLPCRRHAPCPKVLGDVWIANVNGTLLTYDAMHVAGVKGAASGLVGVNSTAVGPAAHGGSYTQSTSLPMAWLRSLTKQTGWPTNAEPAEYFQMWSALTQFAGAGKSLGVWVQHLLKRAHNGTPTVQRINFQQRQSYRIRFPLQSPQAATASVGLAYVDAGTYAVEGIAGLTCPTYGKSYSPAPQGGHDAPSRRSAGDAWVPQGCVQPRFAPKCFVDVGGSTSYVWMPEGCPNKVSPFQATLVKAIPANLCQVPESLFGRYFKQHPKYTRGCRRQGAVSPQTASSYSSASGIHFYSRGAWLLVHPP